DVVRGALRRVLGLDIGMHDLAGGCRHGVLLGRTIGQGESVSRPPYHVSRREIFKTCLHRNHAGAAATASISRRNPSLNSFETSTSVMAGAAGGVTVAKKRLRASR